MDCRAFMGGFLGNPKRSAYSPDIDPESGGDFNVTQMEQESLTTKLFFGLLN